MRLLIETMNNLNLQIGRCSVVIDLVPKVPNLDLRTVRALAAKAQNVFNVRLAPPPTDPLTATDLNPDRCTIFVTNRPEDLPFRLSLMEGLHVSTWQLSGIRHFTRISSVSYLLICSMMGALHWRSLGLNHTLSIEDLRHDSNTACLFSAAQSSHDDFILHLENPCICHDCREFFRFCGIEGELNALQQVIDNSLPHDAQ